MPLPSTQQALDEVGLTSVIKSPFDVKLLCIQRFVRMFAFGSAALVLALYLEELGYADQSIGLFMTLTMLGDVLISLLLTLFADGLGRKNVLVAGSLLVVLSGIVFATTSSYWALLAAAIVGVISPSGNEIGPFRAIEESTISSLAPTDIPNSRSDIFAWYALLGSLGSALGSVSSGGIVHVLTHRYEFSVLRGYRALFWLYGGLGLVKVTFALGLSRRVEVDYCEEDRPKSALIPNPEEGEDVVDESRPLLGPSTDSQHSQKQTSSSQSSQSRDGQPTTPTANKANKKHLIPRLSAESKGHLFKLIPLFAIDNFASGLVPLSWLSPFFHDKYSLSHSALGVLFFSTSLASAASNILSASFVRRAGLLYTMVFTHLPNDVFLALVPLPAPHLAWLAVTFLLLRNATSTMDTAPRQAFISALLDPTERTAVMGFVNVIRTISQSVGPYASGVLKERQLLWLSFVLAGALKACYDFGMLAAFWRYRNGMTKDGKASESVSGSEDEQVGDERSRHRSDGPIDIVDNEPGRSNR